MALFGKQFRPGMGGGVEERLAALETLTASISFRIHIFRKL